MKQVHGWWVPSTDGYFDEKTLKPEGFDIDHLEVALRYVTQWRTAVDAGSHIGTWAKAMATKFARVLAIEPDAENYSCLLRNTEHLPNVYPYKFALSNEDGGEVAMMESTTRPGNSGSRFVTTGRGIPTHALDSLALDTLGFLKIDVEGHECPVVEGGKETIVRCRPVIMLEEKRFTDRTGRLATDHKAAGRLLESWGMTRTAVIKRDVVFTWP